MNNASCFKIVSIGTVAENKALSSKVISVSPIEQLTMFNGEVRSNPVALETTGLDRNGNNFATSVATDNVVQATWLPFGSNRKTAPDVRRGERVLIWATADADQYYWTVTGMDDRLRKLETVVWAFSANPAESSAGDEFDNCYYLEMSTHNKSITLQTTTLNGEPYAYTCQFNLAEGAFILQDDDGNLVEIDSKEKRISLNNSANSKVDLKAGKIAISAPEEVSITVGGTSMVFTPAMTTLKTPIFKGGS